MESREFYNRIEEYVNGLNKEEIIEFISNMIRKVPKSEYEDILCMTNISNMRISNIEIENKIEEFKQKFEKIESGDLHFYAEQYEEYEDGWSDWKNAYHDKDKIGHIIDEAIRYAENLVKYKKYYYARAIMDMVLKTNYTVIDEDIRTNSKISLTDIKDNNLILEDISTFCLYVLYTTYQSSNNKVEDIYNYFISDYAFMFISLEDCFELGVEKPANLEEFYAEWIEFLANTEDNTAEEISLQLLKKALKYIKYANYEKYIDAIIKNQPKTIIEILEYLERENKTDELILLGDKALQNIDSSLKIGSPIALFLAKINPSRQEEYVCKAFEYDTSVLNLLRIINNGYYEKNREKINSLIKYEDKKYKYEPGKNVIDEGTYYLLQFFTGNFETFYNECIKHNKTLGWTLSFEKTAVYLWLLILNESNIKTKSSYKIMYGIFEDIDYSKDETQMLGNYIDEIWNEWRKHFEVDKSIKANVIKWLHTIIEKRVDDIMKGNYRTSYYKAALIVVAFGEMLSSQKLYTRNNYINYYIEKYPRRSAFRRELNELI